MDGFEFKIIILNVHPKIDLNQFEIFLSQKIPCLMLFSKSRNLWISDMWRKLMQNNALKYKVPQYIQLRDALLWVTL